MSFAQRLRDESALPTTYDKGCHLAQNGAVLTCDATPSAIDGVVRLTGSVEASAGAPYRTHATLDLNDGDIVDYGCDCPAQANYPGMCKHAVALVATYLGWEGIEMVIVPGRGKVYGGYKSASPRDVPSSPQIAGLLAAITNEEIDAVAAARRPRFFDEDDLVDLRASLAPASSARTAGSADTWLLKLKVCRGKASYVVKNIAALARAWRSGVEVSYGKNLSFVHVPSSFTPRARQVLELATRVVESQQALFTSRYTYWGAGNGTDVKELPLSHGDVVQLLDIYQGSTIAFESPVYPAVPERTLQVVQGDPVVAAEIAPVSGGGYDLCLPRPLDCFWADGRLYLLDGANAWACSEGFSAKGGTVFSALLPVGLPLHIGQNDIAGFCRTALPSLRACTALTVPAALDALVPPTPAFTFKIGLEDGVVSCTATVAYGDDELDLYEPQRSGQPARDMAAEYGAQTLVETYFPGAAGALCFDESDDELLYLLLTEGLGELAQVGEVLLSERLRSIKTRSSLQLRVKATVYGGLLDLKLGASGMTPRDIEAYLASYKRRERYLRLSNGDVAKIDQTVRMLDDLSQGLGVDGADLVAGVEGLPASRTLFVDALLKKAEGVRLDRNEGFRAIVRDFETYADAPVEMPASLAETLRPYQEDGVRWLGTLERLGFGGILADDMGLGKTLQVIAHLLACKESGIEGPTLVVAPASLVYNWMAELERFAPQLRAVAVLGAKAQREAIVSACAEYDVLVTSYDLMKRDVDAYMRRRFRRVVLDEAQYIKNPTTQAAKCAKCLPADVCFALTGTPIENRVAELWSIFDFLMPGTLGSRDAFSKRYEGAVENREAPAAERLRCLVSPFVLRRLKSDVLADLPEKSESVVLAPMAGEQARLYKAAQDRLALQIAHELPEELQRTKLQVLAELTKLRQLCCDPRLFYEDYRGGSAKLDTCLELVRNAVDGGHSVLVFSQFTSMLGLIAERLGAEKIAHFTLTGSTGKGERARLVDRFQAGERPVFLISLKAGGVGLNLTAADVVIHYDPWWNLAAQNQATDRAHRIGQQRAVSVFKLIAADTIEERIVAMQERKRDLAASVLGGEAMASTQLSREDVLALLGAEVS